MLTFSPAALAKVLHSYNRYGDKYVLRVGRFNGVFFYESADQHYARILHSNLKGK